MPYPNFLLLIVIPQVLEKIDYIISDKNLILDGEEIYIQRKWLNLPEIWNAHFGFTI